MTGKRVLVTGANGFVGSNLYTLLSGDFHFTGLDISTEGKYPEGEIFNWNELEKIPPVDAIIHLAGKAHDTANTSREEEYFDVNVGLTKQIFEYFLQSGAEKFIFFSSVKAVADTIQGEWLTEEDTPDPKTPYGKSKLEAERYIVGRLQEYFSQYPFDETRNFRLFIALGEGGAPTRRGGGLVTQNPEPKTRNPKLVYILRPAMIHGPGNRGNLNLLYKVVNSKMPWPLGAFSNQRSFASIQNVAFVIRELIGQSAAPGIYILADDETLSTNGIIQLMAASLNRKPVILKLPQRLIRVIARTGDLLRLPVNSERLKKLTESYCVSNNKLKAALGIDRLPVSAREGLALTLASFRMSTT